MIPSHYDTCPKKPHITSAGFRSYQEVLSRRFDFSFVSLQPSLLINKQLLLWMKIRLPSLRKKISSNDQMASEDSTSPTSPPAYFQSTSGSKDLSLSPSSSSHRSNSIISPLQVVSIEQYSSYSQRCPSYPSPSGITQELQHSQQSTQHKQTNYSAYRESQAQQCNMYESGLQSDFPWTDEKVIVLNEAKSTKNVAYDLPPEHLSSEIFNVCFNKVQLRGDDQHHALRAIQKADERDRTLISDIVGTYLEMKRTHELNRLYSALDRSISLRSGSKDVVLYNDLMEKLERLSRAVLTSVRHRVNAQVWIEVLNPHRRAIFVELYNTNPIVRCFCSGLEDGPEAFPVLDDWAFGTRGRDLSFQRAGRRDPNWNVARELISEVRTVVLLDDSASMAAPGHTTWGYGDYGFSKSRWEQARDLLAGIAPLVSSYSQYGIDIHFLNRTNPLLGLRTTNDVMKAFEVLRPGGGTPTGRRINEILDGYMCVLRYNRSIIPLNLVVITDGEAQDESTLHRAIEEHVTKIVHHGFKTHQFGIEFLQVGDDEEATRHLLKLEEEVSRHHHAFQRDVVGVTPTNRQLMMNPDQLLGIILSGIDARMNGYMRHRRINV